MSGRVFWSVFFVSVVFHLVRLALKGRGDK